jgi:hypothetical protein
MNNAELQKRCNIQLLRNEQILNDIRRVQSVLNTAEQSLSNINWEKELIERSLLALKQVRPLLSGSSIKDCEELANSAIKSIFGFDYKVEYDMETNRFVLNKGEYSTDLSEAEGGGIITVISFVFLVYLIVKLNKRRVIYLDEAFTQVSDAYFGKFIEFINRLCQDLGFDLLLVSHDQRITYDDVDHVYQIANGKSKQLK